MGGGEQSGQVERHGIPPGLKLVASARRAACVIMARNPAADQRGCRGVVGPWQHLSARARSVVVVGYKVSVGVGGVGAQARLGLRCTLSDCAPISSLRSRAWTGRRTRGGLQQEVASSHTSSHPSNASAHPPTLLPTPSPVLPLADSNVAVRLSLSSSNTMRIEQPSAILTHPVGARPGFQNHRVGRGGWPLKKDCV